MMFNVTSYVIKPHQGCKSGKRERRVTIVTSTGGYERFISAAHFNLQTMSLFGCTFRVCNKNAQIGLDP